MHPLKIIFRHKLEKKIGGFNSLKLWKINNFMGKFM